MLTSFKKTAVITMPATLGSITGVTDHKRVGPNHGVKGVRGRSTILDGIEWKKGGALTQMWEGTKKSKCVSVKCNG
uniref:Uncharacterized protein n=1 Tax=Anguilla anguilla TaxID=7936 RepID=A0A0E9WCZ5_ANGAN